MSAPRPGCHNRPRPQSNAMYIAQDGWREYIERGRPVRVPVFVEVPHVMTTDCQTDLTTPGCAGCVHGVRP